MKSILISSPGRCGMHWLSRILRGVLGLGQQKTKRWCEMGEVANGQLYLTHDPLAYFIPVMDRVNCIVMVRDPRDMIVSVAYYLNGPTCGSWERIHELWGTEIPEGIGFQETLAALKQKGHNNRWFSVYSQTEMPHFIVRYEDLHQRTEEVIIHLLSCLEYGNTPITEAIDCASFERVSGGRERGEEDSSHFYRKGIVGDWHNYFTNEENLKFQVRFLEIFRVFGYD